MLLYSGVSIWFAGSIGLKALGTGVTKTVHFFSAKYYLALHHVFMRSECRRSIPTHKRTTLKKIGRNLEISQIFWNFLKKIGKFEKISNFGNRKSEKSRFGMKKYFEKSRFSMSKFQNFEIFSDFRIFFKNSQKI